MATYHKKITPEMSLLNVEIEEKLFLICKLPLDMDF